jgi:GT2 family glycosyltransferase
MDSVISPSIEISIVLVTCGRAGLLEGALHSLLHQRLEPSAAVELIVVDDASTDRTPKLLAQLQRTAPIPIHIVQGASRGVAHARNLAAARAAGTWLASFDDDQLAQPGWLQALYQTARQTGAAVVGGALHLHLPPGHTVESLGPRTRAILGEHIPCEAGPYPAGVRPATNNVLIRRDLFQSLGGYDTTFTEGAEDADFFDRAAASGHTLSFEPAAEALHLIPPRRLDPAALRWTSLRVGAGDVRLHQRRQAVLGPLRLAALRLAVAIVRDLPQLAWATLRRDRRTRLDVLCSLWYTQGVLRAWPAFLTSRQDSAFLRSLNFRVRNGERPEATPADTTVRLT